MTGGRVAVRAGSASSIEAMRVVGLALTTVSLFAPYLVGRMSSPSIVLIVALWLYVTARLLDEQAAQVRQALWIALPILGVVVAYALNTQPVVVQQQLGDWPPLATQYLLVLPVGFVAGMVASRDERLRTFLQFYLAAATVHALLSLAERLTGRPFFPDNTVHTTFSTTGDGITTALTAEGQVRGIVASEHPLVLGVLLAVAVPLAFRLFRRRLALPIAVLLVAGIWATDSNGPLMISIVVTLLGVLRPRRGQPVPRGIANALRVAVGIGTVAFLAASAWLWQPVVNTMSDIDESTQYRFALYSLVPRLIANLPGGYGLGHVPSGTILIDRTGPALDVSVSVDSELVLLVIQAGLAGLLVFGVAMLIAIEAAIRSASVLAPSLMVLMTSGMFLALHVWPAAGSLTMVLIGAGVRGLIATRTERTRPASRWQPAAVPVRGAPEAAR